MISGLFSLFMLFIIAVVALVACVFWIWMLISAVVNKGLNDGEKIGWVLVVLFLHFIGAIIYFFIGRPKRI